jgi:glycosyltransferase involved in cell wall biosynthesis
MKGREIASKKVSVVIPVYNERATIEDLLQRVQAVEIEKEIIIVDDASTDGTREFLQEVAQASKDNSGLMTLPRTGVRVRTYNIKVFFQERNCGKGAAVHRGFQEAQGEIVIVQDADLEYDPQDYHKLLEPIGQGVADVVYGSRFLGGTHRVVFFWHYLGNKFLTTFTNMFTNLNLSDAMTCYKVFRREVLQTIELREQRFGFDPEVTAKMTKGSWRVFEVPISYHGRTYADGKKITWKDGLKTIWCILRYNLYN